jgi:hypothetical protein
VLVQGVEHMNRGGRTRTRQGASQTASARIRVLALRAWMESLRITDHEARLAALESLLVRNDAARTAPTGLQGDPEDLPPRP